MIMTGAQVIVRFLEDNDVSLVAGIPGGAVLPIYDALATSSRIRHVLVRHEQAAGFVAQGFARATGQIGVCLASSGPGATNLVTAVADAQRDSIPLLVITGQVPRALLGTDAFQEVDARALARPVTKFTALVRHADDLAPILRQALRMALGGRPGPVWIDIPRDVQTEMVSADPEPTATAGTVRPAAPLPQLVQAANAIASACRPILYLGGGLVSAGAGTLARALAEREDIPAVMTLMALGVLPKDHPLSLGMLGMHATQATHAALRETDLLVALGARFDDRATGRLSDFCPTAGVIHVDIDPRELGKLRTADIAIEGDLHSVLAALMPLMAGRTRPDWRERIAQLKRAHPPAPEGARGPRALLAAVAQAAPADRIVVTDVGQHQMWVAQHFPLAGPRRFLTSGGLGTMGFGLPAAIGAALARPEECVICFTGDGSLLMNIQELATLREQGLNIKIIVFDNGGLGLVVQQQSSFYTAQAFGSRFTSLTDYPAVARGFGIPAQAADVCAPREFWEEIFARPGPCLIHVPIDAAAQVLPIVPPGAAHWEAIGA